MECLPVAITLSSPELAVDVARYVESELGWQVVDDSPHFPASLVIADAPIPGRQTVCIGGPGFDIAGALRAGAKEALIWPDDALRLKTLTLGTKGVRTGRRLVISQSGRQVGASTMALVIGAVYAWAGVKVALAADPGMIRAAGMHHAGRVLACPNLWLIDPSVGPPDGFGMVIVEAPLSEKTQIVIGRPDRDLVQVGRRYSGIRRVISIGEGELLPSEVARLVGRRRHGHLVWSHRVARAGLRGALPQALPGRMLKQVATLVGQPIPGIYKAAPQPSFERSSSSRTGAVESKSAVLAGK